MGAFEGTTDQQLEQQVNTNFLGTILIAKAFLPYLRKRKSGKIITVTSSTANILYPFVAVYAATKAALETWSEGMTNELNEFGIAIKTIVPAYMQTNFGTNAQMVSHQDYQEVFNQYITAMKADTSAKRKEIRQKALPMLYMEQRPTTRNNYITRRGNLSTEEYAWLKKDGIEKVIPTMNNRFFE
jgi:short-subunit dehydrogenase